MAGLLVTFPVLGTLSSCIACMFFVEAIAKEDPSSMNLMTFSTFLFVSLVGLVFTSKFFTVRNNIPLKGYLPTTITFFIVSVINNQALSYHVPVPLHIIFRSGSLLSSLLLTKLIQGKQYSLTKHLSVLLITVGVIVCTLATSSSQTRDATSVDALKYSKELLIGIALLIAALLLSSYLAICQETMYKTYGKHSFEAMFVVHSTSLPFFAFMGEDIYKSMQSFSQSSPMDIFGFSMPHMWIYLLCTCVFQWLCIACVYQMNATLDPLTVTLVVTLRKFLSLIISVVWFRNAFTVAQWLGALMVFAGTLTFADVHKFSKKFSEMKKKKQ